MAFVLISFVGCSVQYMMEKEKIPFEIASFTLIWIFVIHHLFGLLVDVRKIMNKIKQSNRLLYSLTFSVHLLLLPSSLWLTLRCNRQAWRVSWKA